MKISKEEYNQLLQDSQRYRFLKYEATVEQWVDISNVNSVEEVDEMLDLFIAKMWEDEE